MALYGASVIMGAAARLLRYFVLYTLGSGLVTLFSYLPTSKGGMVNHTAPSLFFVFLVIYTTTLIFFEFAVSTLFDSGKLVRTLTS